MGYKIRNGIATSIGGTVFIDIKDSHIIEFDMLSKNEHISIFTDKSGVEHRVVIKNKKAKLPPALLKEQIVRVVVDEIKGDKILRSIECEPLQIKSHLNMRFKKYQVYPVFSETADKVTLNNNKHDIAELQAVTAELQAQVIELAEKAKTLKTSYNQAIEVLNDLSKRVVEVEKNYDPTIIK